MDARWKRRKIRRPRRRVAGTPEPTQPPQPTPPPQIPPPQPASQPPNTPQLALVQSLPVKDLLKEQGGVWNLKGKVNWKKSSVVQFDGRACLRAFYGKGSGTSSDPGVGGVAFTARPDAMRPHESVMAFDVFFEEGWNFSKGGKIGGFFIGEGNASGYRHSDTASSHRIMWKKDGAAIAYIYPPSNLKQEDASLKPEGCGIAYFMSTFAPGTLKIGAWNSVVIGVRMNSFSDGKPNPDGVALLGVNGITRTKTDIRWSRSPDLSISSFDFNTFFGGPDPSVKDCAAYYANFRLVGWP